LINTYKSLNIWQLKKILFEFVYALIRYSGITIIIKHFFARNSITIILYHNPDLKIFESHLKYLSSRYNFISLNDLKNALFTKNWNDIPQNALVVTFDDGWKNNFLLLDSFKKYKLRPIIYLTSHIINTERNFWWSICSTQDANKLKHLPNDQRKIELQEIYSFFQEKEFSNNRQALNLDEINQMKEFVDFGIHTCFHPILTKCSYEEKKQEIGISLIKLRELLDKDLKDFAYPNGCYNSDCIEILKDFNIQTARTVDAGWTNKLSDPFKLKISGVSDNGSMNKFISELSGIPLFIQYLVKGSLKGLNEQL
jgi:poly-beta-1,6-N-acetyl-D-glucosamine N-deacetylase